MSAPTQLEIVRIHRSPRFTISVIHETITFDSFPSVDIWDRTWQDRPFVFPSGRVDLGVRALIVLVQDRKKQDFHC